MAVELTTTSPVKVITSGNVPTAAQLAKGQIGFGLIGGAVRAFGNNGTSILEFKGAIYAAAASGGLTLNVATGEFSIAEGGVTETFLAAALATKINGKADASNVLLKDGTTAFTPTADYHPATKKYTDDSISALGALFTLKGRVDTFAQLPTTGNKTGHVWLVGLVTDPDLTEYVYTSGGTWEKLGTVATVDLSNYYNKSEVDQLLSDLETSILDDVSNMPVSSVANQPISMGGKIGGMYVMLTNGMYEAGSGLELNGTGKLRIKASDINITMTVVEI